MTGTPFHGHVGPVAEQRDRLTIRYDEGPWDGAVWTPANAAGVLSVHRVDGWAGAYRRHHIDARGIWRYRWTPDPAPDPPPPPTMAP